MDRIRTASAGLRREQKAASDILTECDGARSVGLLADTTQVSELLASGVQAGDRIGITVEPAGGTAHPTTTPVIVMPLTA